MHKNGALLRKPVTDDRRLWDVIFGIWGYPAVFVAQELRFFELLAGKPLTLDEICARKHLNPRPAHMLLAICTSLGLMRLRNGRYSLTPTGREYMLPSSPYFFGWFYDAWRKIFSVWTPDSLRDAVVTNKPQGVFSDPTGVFAAWHAEHARDFARDAQRKHRARDGMASQARPRAQSSHARCRRRLGRSFNWCSYGAA
jgi:hypothetical protein